MRLRPRFLIPESQTVKIFGMWKDVLPALAALLAFEYPRLNREDSIVIFKENILQTYDFIVVGGGTAGSVVAARLSELPNATVLVLEAGYDDEDFPNTQWMPMEQQLQLGDFDWKYKTVPQRNCCDSLVDKESAWPRGKGLGGCSSHNGAAHVRGSRYDYERWNSELGDNGGWGFDDVLPYFKKLENVDNIDNLKSNPKLSQLHGFDGPIVLTQTPLTPLARAYLEAAKAKGFRWRDDINAMGEDDDQEGFSEIQRARSRGGRRMSTSEGYLRPAARQRPSQLHVLTLAHVTRILFDEAKSTPRALGVEFVHENKTYVVWASKEVIISGGTINSPQLLMLSGIGPEDHLKEHGVRTLVDNPAVGQNMYDHLFTPMSGTVNESVAYEGVDVDDTVGFPMAKMQYYLLGDGPLANSAIEWTAFVRSRITEDRWPDLQLYLIGAPICRPHRVFNLNEKAVEAMEPPETREAGRFGFGLMSILLHPHNAGEIRLRSANPFDHPLIDPKYLQNDFDVDIMVKGLKILIDLAKSNSTSKYDTKLVDRQAPGCEKFEMWSDDYLKCHVRSTAMTVYHPVGTCRMGKKGQNSVVDKRLRVHGVTNLRVVDASIFPYQVSANTNAATIMVGEKGADLIKEDFRINFN